MRVLDCCCAPGTKTLRIANRLENSGEVVGIDIAPTRIKLTQDLMKRLVWKMLRSCRLMRQMLFLIICLMQF